MADESSEVMLDINSLETEATRLLIPFLRTASLMKLYIYKENLPEIKEDDEEFDQLVKFLDLISVVEAASGLRGHGADKHMHSDQPTDETEVHMEDESTQMSFQVRLSIEKNVPLESATDFLIDGRRIGLFRGARNTTGWRELGTQITPRGWIFWTMIFL